MTNDDELRQRLAAFDPQASTPVDPVTSPRAQELLERIMTNDTLTETSTPAPSRPRRLAFVSAAAAIAVVAAGAIVLSNRGDDSVDTAIATKKTTLALNLPAPAGLTIGTCIMLTPETVRLSPVAFAGTVTAVDAGTVSLDVTHWYAGGTAQVVTLSAPDNSTVTQEGQISFDVGGAYLVSADRGTVGTCGLSGPASPELTALYEQAFPN